MKKMLSIIVVLALLLSTTAFAAPAPKTVVTGRTEQARATGVITPAPVTTELPHNVTTELVLAGTVVIDGPQLEVTVSREGADLGRASVTKVADKTWTYSLTVNPSVWKGNTSISVSAKTVYINGQTAGQTHTTASVASQPIHVAYVADFEYSDFIWGTYDREQNRYPYSYTLVKIWDNGQRVNEPVNGWALAAETVTIEADDLTYDGGPVTLGTETAPAAPAPQQPVVSNVSVANTVYKYTGNKESEQKNVKVGYTLHYSINENAYSVENLNHTFNNGVGYHDQEMTYEAAFDSQTVIVNYTLRFAWPNSSDDNTTN